MNIINKKSEKYTIQKVGDHTFNLVKILKTYENHKDAIAGLTDMAIGEITEKDLTGSTFEQDIDSGKSNNRILVLEAALRSIRSRLENVQGEQLQEEAIKEVINRIDSLVV